MDGNFEAVLSAQAYVPIVMGLYSLQQSLICAPRALAYTFTTFSVNIAVSSGTHVAEMALTTLTRYNNQYPATASDNASRVHQLQKRRIGNQCFTREGTCLVACKNQRVWVSRTALLGT